MRGKKSLAFFARGAVLCGLAGSLLAVGLTPPAGATPSSKLQFTRTPANATAGKPFATQPQVTVENSSGTPIKANTSKVTLKLNATNGATLTGCKQTGEKTGVVSFATCEIDRAGTGYTLSATDTGFASATSGSFNVAAGKATKVVFTQQPGPITGGTTFSPAVTLTVEDAKGNAVKTTGIKLDLTAQLVKNGKDQGPLTCTGGETTPSGTHAGIHAYELTANNGSATFTKCTIDQASPTPYYLIGVATIGGTTLLPVQSTAFHVSVGPATQLAFTTEPGGALLDQAFGVQPHVSVEDAGGNVVSTTGKVDLAITTHTGTAGAQLLGCGGGTLTAGATTFTGCYITENGAGYTLSATVTLTHKVVKGTSRPFTVSAGAAAKITFTKNPGDGTGGSPLTAQPVVTITDGGGNLVSGAVQLSLETTPTGVTLSCTPNPDPAGTGTATFTNCAVNKDGTYHLVATDADTPTLTAVSTAFTITTGPAANAVFVHSPSSSTGGVAFSTQPTVSVQDLGGNPVHHSTITLSIAPGTGTNGAALTCTGDPGDQAAATTGTVTFTGCSINAVGTGYRLTATSGANKGTSTPFTVELGPPTKLEFTAEPSGGTVSTPFGGQPQVAITDAGGNPEPTSGVEITLSISSGTLSCLADPVPTDHTGTSVFAGCKTAATGAFTLEAAAPSADHLLSATSGTFTIVGGTPLGETPAGVPVAQTFGSATVGTDPTSVTDDVDSATGALDLGFTDLKMAAVGEPLTLSRQYNSDDSSGGSFGPGWSSILDAGVQVAPDAKTAVVRGADGQQLVFTSNGSGGWKPPAGAHVSLSCQGTLCTVTQYDGTVWQSVGGQIQDYLSADGIGLHFIYSQGHLTEITGSAKTLVEAVETSLGTTLGTQGWTTVHAGSSNLDSIAALDATHLWAVGANCTLEFSGNGGATWTAGTAVAGCPTGADLTSVVSDGAAGPAFAVGTEGAFLECATACNSAAAGWVRPAGTLPHPSATLNFTSVWSPSSSHVYVVGTTTGGAGQIWACLTNCAKTGLLQSWVNVTPAGLTSTALNSISGHGTTFLVVAGAKGTVLVCATTTCTKSSSGWAKLHAGTGGVAPGTTVNFTGLWVGSTNRVFAVGARTPAHGGSIWACAKNCTDAVTGASGSSAAQWQDVTPATMGSTGLRAVSGLGTSTVWAVAGNGQIWYCPANCATEPTGWTPVGAPGGSVNGLAGVTSASPGHAWAVGGNGTVTYTTAPTSTLTAIQQAIAALGVALTPSSWTDGNDLSTAGGGKALTQLVDAVDLLGSGPPASDPAWEAVDLLDIEQAMRIVDANALSENITGPLHPTSLTAGEKQFSTGTTDMASGADPASASAYKSAWADAIAADGSGQGSHTPLHVTVRENLFGEVTAVTTPTRSVHYGYTGSLLTSFTDANGHTWSYSYTTAPTRLLTRVVDPTGHTRLTVAYSGGRVSAASSLGSQTHFVDRYTWNPTTQTSTRWSSVQLAVGAPDTAAQYLDEYGGNVLLAQQLPDGATTSYSYDTNLDLTGIQDPLGHVQRMTYSAAGDLLTQTSPQESGSAVVSFTYDASHQLLSTTDADKNTTKDTYTGANLAQITPPGPSSDATHYHFNYLGEEYEVVGPTATQTFTYDSAGNQTGFRLVSPKGGALDGLGPVFSYDEAGQKTVSTDPRGHTSGGLNHAYQTTNTYDADGELLSTTSPGPQTTTDTYRPGGSIASVQGPTGHTTTYSWNESALQLTLTGPSGTTVSTYDPAGHLLEQTTGGAATTYTYDASGRQTSQTGPTRVTTYYTFDLEGNVVATSTSTGDPATYTYDVANQVTSATVNGVATYTSYDLAGNVISQTDADGRVTTFTYNSHGLLAGVTTTAGTTSYTYDPSNNLVAVTDGNGHTIRYQVNGAGERTQMTVAGAATTYTYDSAGNLVSSTDPDGRTTTYTVNAENERTQIAYSQTGQPTIDVRQTFDAAGHRTSVTDPTTGLTTYTYDQSGDLLSASGGTGTYSYDYTTPGKMVETYPDGTKVTYAYDDSHRLMSVSATGVGASYVRNTSRQVTGIAYSNGIFQTQSYDPAGFVTSTALTCGGTTELTRASSFDPAGYLLGEATTAGTTTTTDSYGYDSGARLDAQLTATTKATTPLPDKGCITGSPPGTSGTPGTTTDVTPPTTPNQPVVPAEGTPGTGTSAHPITYDAVGDITSIDGIKITYTTNDEVTSETGTGHASYTYDRNGDVTSTTVGGTKTTYSYNAADELVAVTKGATKVTYEYDGNGNRVERTVTTSGRTTVTDYSWDPSGSLPLLTLVCNGDCATRSDVVERFIYGVGPVAMETASATYYLHEDQQGDVIAVSNGTGQVVQTYNYDALGNVTPTHLGTGPVPQVPLLFQGQYLDSATGLYDMRARNYDPATGTFTQRDPTQPAIGAPVVSPYSFADDRWTLSADPTGDTSGSSFVDSVYYGHSTQTADIVGVTRDVVGVTLFGLKSGRLIAQKYASDALADAAPDVEATASAIRTLGPEYATDADAVGADLGGLSDAAPSLAGGVGKLLGVAGFGLGIYLTVEDCEHGTVSQCVGDSIGLALGVACTVLTEGAGALACGMAAAAIGLIVSEYGPEIAEGLADLGEYEIEGVTDAINAVQAGFEYVGDALQGAYEAFLSTKAGMVLTSIAGAARGVITTGFNLLSSFISNGFKNALSLLVAIGETPAQIGSLLKNFLGQELSTVVNDLISLGVNVYGIASALADAFGLTAHTLASILNGLHYTLDQIAASLDNVLHETLAEVASVLQGIKAGLDDIADALTWAFHSLPTLVTKIAGALKSIGITVGAIAGVLKTVFDKTAKVVATILDGLEYGADAIVGALEKAFTDLAAGTVAAAIKALFTPTQIAHALNHILGTALTTIYTIFKTVLGLSLTVFTGVLKNVFGLTPSTITGFLKNTLGIPVTTIANALKSVFSTLTISTIVHALGNWFTNTVIGALGGAFSSVVTFLTTVATTVASWF